MASEGFSAFVRQVVSSKLYRPNGTVETTRSPAVWTLAHRGYSGSGRLDLWVYPTKSAALKAGAVLAMECGLDEDPTARRYFARGQCSKVLARYEELRPSYHVLRVLPARIQRPRPDGSADDTNDDDWPEKDA
ncbi:Uncharacterised protein [Mycobacteroides abscessus subsp. abscessus]|uniref:hypothetical protein n=1 Tax=Mycobacteroides abscessus TaxID=36809 RepID=UPI00092707DA|nr:hypothetical protein [Mycobacteroides abscessus]SHU67553.1 Uncharacterised protein [Mycobacteroides abscessus subsp. abscessus]